MATNRAPQVEAVTALFLTLTWITALMRCYVRGVMAKTFGLEDLLAIIALILFTLTAIFALKGISHSMGLHLLEIMASTPQDLTPAMMYWFSTELAYVATTCALKMSIAVFLLRIAVTKSHRIILYVTMAFVMIFSIGYFLFLVFQCSPVNYFWLQFNGTLGSCLAPETVGALTYTHSGLNAFADIILALLPVVIVSQLQINPRTKITVSVILSMGIIACVAVIIRIPYVKILVDNAEDFLFSSTNVVIWSAVEPGIAITAANMATLRPLFSAWLSRTKLWGTTTAHAKSSGYGHSKKIFAFSNHKGYMRSGSRGKVEEMGLSSMDRNGDETTIEAKYGAYGSGHTRSKLDSRISEEGLQHGNSWDIERQPQQNAEPIGEWPISPNDIRKTVRTEIWSGAPLPHLPAETYNGQLPGPRTDGRKDVWPDIRPGSNHGRRKSNHSLHGATSNEW